MCGRWAGPLNSARERGAEQHPPGTSPEIFGRDDGYYHRARKVHVGVQVLVIVLAPHDGPDVSNMGAVVPGNPAL